MFGFPFRLPLDFAKVQKFHLNRRARRALDSRAIQQTGTHKAVTKTARAWSVIRHRAQSHPKRKVTRLLPSRALRKDAFA
jgi:hypothetical protein